MTSQGDGSSDKRLSLSAASSVSSVLWHGRCCDSPRAIRQAILPPDFLLVFGPPTVTHFVAQSCHKSLLRSVLFFPRYHSQIKVHRRLSKWLIKPIQNISHHYLQISILPTDKMFRFRTVCDEYLYIFLQQLLLQDKCYWLKYACMHKKIHYQHCVYVYYITFLCVFFIIKMRLQTSWFRLVFIWKSIIVRKHELWRNKKHVFSDKERRFKIVTIFFTSPQNDATVVNLRMHFIIDLDLIAK